MTGRSTTLLESFVAMTHATDIRRPCSRRARKPSRRGATIVEMAIIMVVFLTLVLGMVDLGIGVFRYNTLAQAARQVARQAIVHGSMAVEPWGPGTYSALANDASPIAQTVQSSVSGFDLSEVTINVEWIGGNKVTENDHARVTMTTPYRPIMTFIFGNPTFTLQATSTMAIAH